MRLSSLTDIGVKREENQDNYWSALLTIDGVDTGVICLCDGMGGLNDGGLASRLVVEAIRDSIKLGVDFSELQDVLLQSNTTIYELATHQNVRMGTTCTLLQCGGGVYKILHVGDSRCYLYRGNSFQALTTDHSALNKYKITREKDEKLWRRYKNSLTRCIGIKPTVQLDYYEGSYKEGDIFLVCSDGMWHYFDTEEVSIEDFSNLSNLITKCIDSGETDNITGGVIFV